MVNTLEEIVIKKNEYGEYSIREMAEKYYDKKYELCQNVDDSTEFDWGSAFGEETW